MRLRQPDPTTCGSACLVRLAMLRDPELAATLGEDPAGFASYALAVHRGTNSWRDPAGRVQVPWPRALGTTPWALARAWPTPTRVRAERRTGAGDLLARLHDDVAAGPVALYLGTRWLPRHVVLVHGTTRGALRCYEPSAGLDVEVPLTPADPARPLPGLGRFQVPWFTLGAPARPPERRTSRRRTAG
ncbi:hypothetical protein [Nocardioides sp.]|uniref:hypothetical protein n=1 Tax=Nocardioides sp. TaxID=35761 RepID=UPI00351300B1